MKTLEYSAVPRYQSWVPYRCADCGYWAARCTFSSVLNMTRNERFEAVILECLDCTRVYQVDLYFGPDHAGIFAVNGVQA